MAISPSTAMKMNYLALSGWGVKKGKRDGEEGWEDSGETPGCFGVFACARHNGQEEG